MANFFTNLGRKDTWSITADFNHIIHPMDEPTSAQIAHKDPSFWDRLGGCVLLILMTPLIAPVVFYLYWASKKVEKIDEVDKGEVEGRVAELAKLFIVDQKIDADSSMKEEVPEVKPSQQKAGREILNPLKDEAKNSTASSDVTKEAKSASSITLARRQQLLGEALLAFGPHRSESAAYEACRILRDNKLDTPEVKSFLLEEVIRHNQIDKLQHLINQRRAKGYSSDWKPIEYSSNRETFDLFVSIPLHKVQSAAMIREMVKTWEVNIEDPLDDKGNTVFHLVTNPEVAKEILKLRGDKPIPKNKEGENPLHTCQNFEVFKVFLENKNQSVITGMNERNVYRETPIIAVLMRLENLVVLRDQAVTIQEWTKISDQIYNLKKIVSSLFKEELIDISGLNRNQCNVFHLCAQIGDDVFLKEAYECNHKTKGPAGLEEDIPACINGVYYTCCDLAIQRFQRLKERLKTEKQPQIVEKLKEVIDAFKVVIKNSEYLSEYLHDPRKNNFPLHHLIEMDELEFLEECATKGKWDYNQSFVGELNRKTPEEETPLTLVLGQIYKLSQKLLGRPEETEKKELELQIERQKKFLLFLLSLEKRILDRSKGGGVTVPAVNVSQVFLKKKTALHLCVTLGDLDLVQTIVNHNSFDVGILNMRWHESLKSDSPLLMALRYRQNDDEAYKMFMALEGGDGAYKMFVEERADNTSSPQEESSNASFKEFQERIQAQEKIIAVLLSKVIRSANFNVIADLFKAIESEFPLVEDELKVLDFLETPLLQIAFEQLKVSSSPELTVSSKKIIELLIRYNLTKGKKEYHPIFDALESNDPELVDKLVQSKNFDVNVSLPLYPNGPFFVALNALKILKEQKKLDKKHKGDIEEKIKNQKEIIRILSYKNPPLNGAFLHLFVEIGDFSLMEKTLRLKGIDVDILDGKKTLLGHTLNKLIELQGLEVDEENIEEMLNLKQIVRVLIDHGANQDLLNNEERALLANLV